MLILFAVHTADACDVDQVSVTVTNAMPDDVAQVWAADDATGAWSTEVLVDAEGTPISSVAMGASVVVCAPWGDVDLAVETSTGDAFEFPSTTFLDGREIVLAL